MKKLGESCPAKQQQPTTTTGAGTGAETKQKQQQLLRLYVAVAAAAMLPYLGQELDSCRRPVVRDILARKL